LGDATAMATELTGSGVVTQLVAGMNYGIITTPDGVEVYFHRNSVLDGAFDRLDTGSRVRFAAAPGLLGAQAVTVKLL
jgi:cold shock CspA family protein